MSFRYSYILHQTKKKKFIISIFIRSSSLLVDAQKFHRTANMQTNQVLTLSTLCIILVLLAVAALPQAGATEIKVGAREQYRTISQAVSAANPGDTILIGPGTYVENVVVNKQITLASTKGAASTTVKAADTNKAVFSLSGTDIKIQGLTVTGGNNGVVFAKASNCILTKCAVNGNVFGVYLAGATANLVSDNNLNNNGFGIYLDVSSGNRLSNNTASYEKGGGGRASLSDGIYMFNSRANNVTGNELNSNNNFGVSLYQSKSNVFSRNALSSNAQFGVRLRDGSDSNTFVYNAFRANAENGVLIGNSRDNVFYFNNFLEEKSHFYSQASNDINSTKKLNYTYKGDSFSGFVGNYYSNYAGTDKNGNGIGDTQFAGDRYPLVKPIENYRESQPTPTPTPTASASTGSSVTNATSQNITSATQEPQRATTFVPGFESIGALLGLLAAAAIVTRLQKT